MSEDSELQYAQYFCEEAEKNLILVRRLILENKSYAESVKKGTFEINVLKSLFSSMIVTTEKYWLVINIENNFRIEIQFHDDDDWNDELFLRIFMRYGKVPLGDTRIRIYH